MLSGDNSILQRGTEASTQTTHKAVYEGIQLEYLGYLTDKKAGKTTQSFVEYLQGKSMLQSEYQEGTGKYQINVQNLIGASKYGKGNASNGLVDVYMLEKQETTTGRIENTKIATTTPIKIATTSSNETYKVVYYGAEGENSKVELGSITDTNASAEIDNSAAVIAYYNADGNYNEETWGTNNGTNPEKLTYIGSVIDDENYFRYTDGKIYKITVDWDDVNERLVATAAEPVDLDAKISTVNGKIQIQTHFGTFTEDNEEFDYVEGNQEYEIDNSDDGISYYYSTTGILLCIQVMSPR